MLFRCVSAFVLAVFATSLAASPLDACNGADWQAVLRPSPASPPARAVWLDEDRLQWPGVRLGAGERLRLLHGADGELRAVPGEEAA